MFKRAVSILMIFILFFLTTFFAYAAINFTVSTTDESGTSGTVVSRGGSQLASYSGTNSASVSVDDSTPSVDISVSVSPGYYSKIAGEVRAFATVAPANTNIEVIRFNTPSVVLTVNASGGISFSITNNSALAISNYDVEIIENNSSKGVISGQGSSGVLPSVIEGRSYSVKARANSGSFTSTFGSQSNTVNAAPVFTLSVKNTEGGSVGSFSGEYIAGAKITLSATASDGYKFKSWSSNGGGTFDDETLAGAVFTMPPKDVILTASFGKTYKFVIMSSTGGKVWDVDGNYYEGESVKVSAIPSDGYVFDSWVSSDGGKFADSKAVATVFTMPANATTVTATFKEENPSKPNDNDGDENKNPIDQETGMFEIKTSILGNGNIVINQNRGQEGQKITVRANAQAGYVFDCWSSEGGGSFADVNAAATTFIMPAGDVTIIATFVKGDGSSNTDKDKTTEGKEKKPVSKGLLTVILVCCIALVAVAVGVLLVIRERNRRSTLYDDNNFFSVNENEGVVFEYEEDETNYSDSHTREIDFSTEQEEQDYSSKNSWRQRRKRRNEFSNDPKQDDWDD